MSKRTGGLSISYTLDSASEDEGNIPNAAVMPTPNSEVTAQIPKKQPKTRTAGKSKAAETKARGKRGSTGSVTKAATKTTKRATSNKNRSALADISNAQGGSDTEEVDEFDDLPNVVSGAGVKRTAKATEQKTDNRKKSGEEGTTQRRARPKRTSAVETREIPETQQDEIVVQSKLARAKPAGAKNPKPVRQNVVPETQQDTMDVDSSNVQNGEIEEPAQGHVKDKAVTKVQSQSTQHTKERRQKEQTESDALHATNDAALRRKLNEMTRKFEELEFKYRNLREVGVTESEKNFENLKKFADEKAKAADELISSLRADVERKNAIVEESTSLREEVEALKAHNRELEKEKTGLQSSWTQSQNEIKTLQAKLAASRSNSAPLSNGEAGQRIPGSTMKTNNSTKSGSDASIEAQKKALKEDLYCDLTGLIIRDVKRRDEDGEDVYDCIQTGRNGTLHFHLAVANSSSSGNSKTPSGSAQVSYDEAEFQYTPLLDAKHDRDLMEILPDYLTEEIWFPRGQAAKFYSRIVDCLTKKIEVVEDS